MGYKIIYGSVKAEPKKPQNASVTAVTLAICAGILCGSLWIAGKDSRIRDLLIPGDPQVTTAAFSEMVVQLQNGTGFSDAITVFCERILDGARQDP